MKTVKNFIHESKLFTPSTLLDFSASINSSLADNEIDLISYNVLYQKYDALWYLAMFNTYKISKNRIFYFKKFNSSYRKYRNYCLVLQNGGWDF